MKDDPAKSRYRGQTNCLPPFTPSSDIRLPHFNLFDFNGVLVFLFVFFGGFEIPNGHLLAELGVDILQRALAGFGEEADIVSMYSRVETGSRKRQYLQVDSNDIERRGNDEDEKELPRDLVQCNWPSHQDDDGGTIKGEHARRHALAPDMGREDLAEVQILCRIHARTPEGSEQVYEEHASPLSRFVRGAEIFCQEDGFESEGQDDSRDAEEQEFSSAPTVDEQGCQNVPREGHREQGGQKQQWHVSTQSELAKKDDGVIGDEKHAGEHVAPHQDDGHEESLPVGCRLEDGKSASLLVQFVVQVDLFSYLMELLDHDLLVAV